VHTDLLLLLLVAIAGLNALLGLLRIDDGLLDGNVPAITLGGGLGLEGVLVARDLEGKGDSAVLGEISCVGQVEDTGGVLLLVGVLDEEQQTLAGLAGPGDNRVSDLWLLAAEVLSQVGGLNGLLSEPEVLLGEAEGAAVICQPCSYFAMRTVLTS